MNPPHADGAALVPGAIDDFDMLVTTSANVVVGGSLNEGSVHNSARCSDSPLARLGPHARRV